MSKVNYSKELNKRGRNYQYHLKHEYDIEPSNVYFETNLNPEAIGIVLMHIEGYAWDIEMEYVLGRDEILETIEKFYAPITLLDKPTKSYYELDQYLNWERLSSVKTSDIEGLDKAGLKEFINELSVKNDWKGELKRYAESNDN